MPISRRIYGYRFLTAAKRLLRSPAGAASHFPRNEATGNSAVHASRPLERMDIGSTPTVLP
ncbi:hypothetical protein VSQ48_17855 [Candidatus Ventrimonas sp. KK005]|nr:hypothetical protein [Lachnospiraceae bacterium]